MTHAYRPRCRAVCAAYRRRRGTIGVTGCLGRGVAGIAVGRREPGVSDVCPRVARLAAHCKVAESASSGPWPTEWSVSPRLAHRETPARLGISSRPWPPLVRTSTLLLRSREAFVAATEYREFGSRRAPDSGPERVQLVERLLWKFGFEIKSYPPLAARLRDLLRGSVPPAEMERAAAALRFAPGCPRRELSGVATGLAGGVDRTL